MRLPKEVVPLLEKITNKKGAEIEFWKYEKEDKLINLYFDLSAELMMSDIEEDSIPKGYIDLAYIFYWETNCQFSGWYAIENKKDEIDKITSCYQHVGLESEAEGITKATEAWFATNQDHDKVGEAYKSVPNKYQDEEVRFDYISSYFSKHAEKLFYVQ